MNSKKIICLVIALMLVFAVNFTMVNAASGDAIKLTATTDAGVDTGVKYHYQIFDRNPVVFAKGDKLEYEVYLDSNTAGVGSIEIWVSGGGTDCFRDIKSWKDQNDIPGHPNADISAQAYKKWYTRTLPVPDTMDGATAQHWNFGIEKTSVSETYTAYYDNIKVLDKDGKVKAVIYADGAPVANEDNGGPGYVDVSVSQAAAPAAAAPADAAPTSNPKTGDVGFVSYALLAAASIGGLTFLRKKK